MLRASPLSSETLASFLEQSADCVTLTSPDGAILWMNPNGQDAMEIDDFGAVRGRQWADLWPTESREKLMSACMAARDGETVRLDAFCPTAKGRPRWWHLTISAVEDVEGHPAGLLAISRDISESEGARRSLEVATAEMRHRLKNTYAMIGSLLIGFARGTPALESFARDMSERLIALSAAQTLFSTQDAPCEIARLIPALVDPFAGTMCPVTIGALPDTLVSRGQADAIALVLGELAVNSAKHGALAGGGAIHATACEKARWLEIVWEESVDGRVVARERGGGQGLRLIERIVQARQGVLEIDWRTHGLTVTVRFPLP